jgi:hypothetical protein
LHEFFGEIVHMKRDKKANIYQLLELC